MTDAGSTPTFKADSLHYYYTRLMWTFLVEVPSGLMHFVFNMPKTFHFSFVQVGKSMGEILYLAKSPSEPSRTEHLVSPSATPTPSHLVFQRTKVTRDRAPCSSAQNSATTNSSRCPDRRPAICGLLFGTRGFSQRMFMLRAGFGGSHFEGIGHGR